MATSKWSTDEKLIAKMFDNESEDYFKEYEKKGLPKTAEIQIDSIIDAKASTVIDVGSGPGVLMIKMQLVRMIFKMEICSKSKLVSL